MICSTLLFEPNYVSLNEAALIYTMDYSLAMCICLIITDLLYIHDYISKRQESFLK